MAFPDDKTILLNILISTEKLFDELLKYVPTDELPLFQAAWNEARLKLPVIVSQISALQTEGEELSQKLADAGLTGSQLRLEAFKLQKAAKSGWLKRLLKLLNSFLKSLASAIPGGEGLAELKDMFEDSLDGVDVPTGYITTLFNQGGFVPG
jgi:hypothetical protein